MIVFKDLDLRLTMLPCSHSRCHCHYPIYIPSRLSLKLEYDETSREQSASTQASFVDPTMLESFTGIKPVPELYEGTRVDMALELGGK